MPMMAFIGVRISWLMLARKSLLAVVASSAISLARRISSSACLISVTSWATPYMKRGLPSSSRATLPMARIQATSPSIGRL